MDSEHLFHSHLEDHISLFIRLGGCHRDILRSATTLVDAFKTRNKVLVCGNGGSAADSQHFAAELIGRFEKDRDPLPAIALTTDTSILSAIGNDFGFDAVFAKQVRGLGCRGDVLVGISTSGNSPNVVQAVNQAKVQGIHTIGLLGKDGGKLREIVDIPVIISHDVTARIQETHLFILHYWASEIEKAVFP